MAVSLFQDANEMELTKIFSVMDQVPNAGVLTKVAKNCLKQGQETLSSALINVSLFIVFTIVTFKFLIYFGHIWGVIPK